MISSRRWMLLGGGLCLLTVLVEGCEVRHIDLGPTGGAVGANPLARPDAALVSAYGCGDWIDAELNALRVGSCEGQCNSVPGDPYRLDGKNPVMAATAGRWAFCGPGLGPADAVGIEFAPACRVFFLRYDDAGIAVRGTEAAYQADYDIFDPVAADGVARIDLHLTATDTLTLTVDAYRCPERVRLRYGDRAIDLARLDGHGGTGRSVN